MHIKYPLFFLVLLLVSTHLIHAQIYKWTDGSGNVYFSDKPHPGAEEIELPPIQSFSSPAPEPTTPLTEENKSPDANYSISIVEPTDQATIRNNQGLVTIQLQVKPELNGGNKVQVMLDGQPLGTPQASTVFAIQDVKRGAHTLTAKVVDDKGQALATSESLTFFMHRPRVGMVPATRHHR